LHHTIAGDDHVTELDAGAQGLTIYGVLLPASGGYVWITHHLRAPSTITAAVGDWVLGANVDIQGRATVPAGTWMQFDTDGLVSLVRTSYSGMDARGLGVASRWSQENKPEDDISFYPNGQLEHAWLTADATIQGTAFKAGADVRFHEDGTLDTF
jgi:hypothetical protein